MKQNIYSVYDAKLEAHVEHFFARTHGEALRMFEQAVVKEGGKFGDYAEDYTLHFVGEWEDQTAELKDFTNIQLGNAMEMKAQHAGRQLAMPITGGE